MFEITGILKLKKAEQQPTATFKVREFVVTDASATYPQHLLFRFSQERCALLDAVQEGDTVKVGFFVRGREYAPADGGEVRYYNSLDAFRIEKLGASQNVSAQAEQSYAKPAAPSSAPVADDDLPF